MKRRDLLSCLAASAVLGDVNPILSRAGSLYSDQRESAGDHSHEFFYRPKCAWAADFIPLYKDGIFHLFYLLDWRDKNKHGEGTPWYQISTRDFVNFADHGEMLPRGSDQDQDLYVFTGSVLEAEGRYHIFYTGHNPHLRSMNKPEQAVMHAVSEDLMKWRKLPEDIFYAPQEKYEQHDWRDPFVFWNGEANEYWMLLAARLKTGPSRRRGCTALCASKDLRRWEVREPFWAPGLYFTHECPDLFRIGDWWYLVFSEFTDRCVTRYRMSKSLRSPWRTPAHDTFDGRAFYAAKTASDGQRRFLFGWNPTRVEQMDFRDWQWGGNLVVHELIQETDGSLSVRVPDTVDQAFTKELGFQLVAGIGNCEIDGNSVGITAPNSFSCCAAAAAPEPFKIEATVEFADGARDCGIMLRVSDDYEAGYYVRLEPSRNRLVFDSWPRPFGVPYWAELERPIDLSPSRPIDLKVFVDGSVCVVYAANKIAMNTRMYNLTKGSWGFFVTEGSARFRNVKVWGRRA